MNTLALKQHLIDICMENQAKLGYAREKMRLFFPLSSLNHILEESYTAEQMEQALLNFSESVKESLGELGVSKTGERFCITIMEEGCEYVHLHTPKDALIYQIVDVVRAHDVTIAEIKAVFERFSDLVNFTKMQDEEFDYLLYFIDGKPDMYYYCFKEEGRHITYHRFTKEDYLELF